MKIEIVDYVRSSKATHGKHAKINIEILETLLKVKNGQSIKIAHSTFNDARSHKNSLYIYVKRKGLSDSYFIALEGKPDEHGKFNVYVGHKK